MPLKATTMLPFDRVDRLAGRGERQRAQSDDRRRRREGGPLSADHPRPSSSERAGRRRCTRRQRRRRPLRSLRLGDEDRAVRRARRVAVIGVGVHRDRLPVPVPRLRTAAGRRQFKRVGQVAALAGAGVWPHPGRRRPPGLARGVEADAADQRPSRRDRRRRARRRCWRCRQSPRLARVGDGAELAEVDVVAGDRAVRDLGPVDGVVGDFRIR